MEALIGQHTAQERAWQCAIRNMRDHPFTHQPLSITPELRRISLKAAEKELSNLNSEKGRTPIQKLICLKLAFISLENAVLARLPPQNPAPGPPTENPRPSLLGSPFSSLLTKNRHTPATSKPAPALQKRFPEEKRPNEEEIGFWREETMQLVLLLLIHHSPKNFQAHLDLILFHSISDTNSASLWRFRTIFQSSVALLLDTEPHKSSLNTSTSSLTVPDSHLYRSYIWGLVGGQIESFPINCPSLDDQHIISIRCGQKHIIALTSKDSC
jgi:hypothetical protein